MNGNGALRLEIADYAGPTKWRWVLRGPDGSQLAGHEVDLDAEDTHFRAMLDLPTHLATYALAGRKQQDEQRILTELGEWMAETVFDDIAGTILTQGTPLVVRVAIPAKAIGLIQYPFELAHARGKPLALQDVSLVYEIAEKQQPVVTTKPVGDGLRMLAVFSRPMGATTLALRRERYELKKRINELRQREGLKIELRVMQYGATREALADALREGEGWDIVHFSGHGLAAHLVLENEDGEVDLVPSSEFARLLSPSRTQLKLVTLSSCLSAAGSIEEAYEWLGIDRPPGQEERQRDALEADAPAPAKQKLTSVARALVQKLDCAVLAMRYEVGDQFATELCGWLYDGMLRHRQSLDRALQLALSSVVEAGSIAGPEATSAALPAQSVCTPTLVGRMAAGLLVRVPQEEEADFGPPRTSLAKFPPEPERFVGRISEMTKACSALASGSPYRGVVFHGMAGGGKSACALELAYHHQALGHFRGFVWYKAPDQGTDTTAAFAHFADEMEQQLKNFTMMHVVDREDELRKWLPQFRERLEQHAILLVLDNMESLLTADGRWQQEQWRLLVEALHSHNGLSRLVLTTRVRSTEPDLSRALVLPVHALALDEAVLLARQLPNLGAMMAEPSGRGRELVRRAMRVVQGHPKLMELADGQAMNAAAFSKHLDRAEQALEAGGVPADAFFAEGESKLKARDFLDALSDWTRSIVATLSTGSRAFFHFLCCLEEDDRQTFVVDQVWPHLWEQLELGGDVPELSGARRAVIAAGLIEALEPDEGAYYYRLHPGVAEAGKADAGADFRGLVDRMVGQFWVEGFQLGTEKQDGRFTVASALSAAPYLLRCEEWEPAAFILERAITIDASPATIAVVMPMLERIVENTKGSEKGLENASVLANLLMQAGRTTEAEQLMLDLVRELRAHGLNRLASAVMGDLVNLLAEAGRVEEALKLLAEIEENTKRAGLGPWTQLLDKAMRLQLLVSLGRHADVLAEVERLRQQMAELPEESHQDETAEPWNVREVLMGVGFAAALYSGEWEAALTYNAEVTASAMRRNAPELEIAGMRFNDYGPLVALQRLREARDLLEHCRAVFERESDLAALARCYGALAAVEKESGEFEHAVYFQQTALRYSYSTSGPEDCSIGHCNLGNYLERAGAEQRVCLAHTLADGVICLQTSSGLIQTMLRNLAIDFARAAPGVPEMPASFDELCAIVDQVEGVHFRELFERLPRKYESGDAALQALLGMVREEMVKLLHEIENRKDDK